MSGDDRRPDPWALARQEVERASGHYYYSPQQQGIDARTKRLVIERCERFITGARVLDLGYVDGSWTDVALAGGAYVDVVEGARRHVEHGRARYALRPEVRIFHALFEEFEPDRAYDTVIAGDMLRYVADDVSFLRSVRSWLRPGGHLIVTVPNRRSLHRRIGTLLGVEETPDEPDARDREVGNRRSYDRYSLRRVVRAAGFEIDTLRGSFLKPLSSSQMEDWSDDLLRAFLDVGDELEDYCWFLYALARTPAAPATTG
ncbi:MAG: class I SAM-dependent methyltransferase [Vicinamibacterales bacterium]